MYFHQCRICCGHCMFQFENLPFQHHQILPTLFKAPAFNLYLHWINYKHGWHVVSYELANKPHSADWINLNPGTKSKPLAHGQYTQYTRQSTAAVSILYCDYTFEHLSVKWSLFVISIVHRHGISAICC